jgi:hypothetical protein
MLRKKRQHCVDYVHGEKLCYELSCNSAYICTIPYLVNTYELSPFNIKYANQSINNIKKFQNISDLRLHTEAIKCKHSFYFPNITSLKLESAHENFGDGFPTTN